MVTLSAGGYWIGRIRHLGIDVIELTRRRSWEIRRLWRLTRILNHTDPHVVHGFQMPGNVYAVLSSMISRKGRVLSSYRSFDPARDSLHPLQELKSLLAYGLAEKVVCNSETLNADLNSRYPRLAKTVVIHNGIERPVKKPDASITRLKEDLGLPPACPVVGTVGRLVPIKNQSLFLDIAELILKDRPDTRFLLVGGGPLEKALKQLASDLGISRHVVFTGQRPDVPDLLQLFDVFILTTSNGNGTGEGFPNVIMEAMLNGIPCVAARRGGLSELITDGRNGFLVDPLQARVFAQKTVTLLDDPELRSWMGRDGRKGILEKFTVERMVAQFEGLYRSMLQSQPKNTNGEDHEGIHP